MNLCLGSNHLYVFLNPLRPENTPDLPANISWEFAQKEIAHAQGFSTSDASSLPKGWLPVKWEVYFLDISLPLCYLGFKRAQEMSEILLTMTSCV